MTIKIICDGVLFHSAPILYYSKETFVGFKDLISHFVMPWDLFFIGWILLFFVLRKNYFSHVLKIFFDPRIKSSRDGKAVFLTGYIFFKGKIKRRIGSVLHFSTRI